MGTDFAGMSSWTALTWKRGMKTVFKTKSMRSQYLGTVIIKILNFKSGSRKYIFKEIQHITRRIYNIGF